MDSFEDFEGEEEVDYDFTLDEDFLDDGLEAEEAVSAPEEEKGATSLFPERLRGQPFERPSHEVVLAGPAVLDAQPSQDQLVQKSAAGVTGTGDDGSSIPATAPSKAASQEPTPQTEAAADQVEKRESGRKRIPVPAPKSSAAPATGKAQKAVQNGKPAQQNGNGKPVQQQKPNDRRAAGERRNQQPWGGRGDGGQAGRGGQGRSQMEGRGGRGGRGFPPGLPSGCNLRMGERDPLAMAGMPGRFSHVLPPPRQNGFPVLPMPPGLPMPGMRIPLPAGEMGLPPPRESRINSPEWIRDRSRGREQHQQSSAQEFASRFPSMNQYAPRGDGQGRSGLALGMDGALHFRRGEFRNASKDAGSDADRKRVWDRLGPPPQLAGEFDAGDEFEPPRKRSSPGDRARAVSSSRGASDELLMHPGPRMPPAIPPNTGLPMPSQTLGADPETAAADKAKEEAQAQRLAEIQKQIDAQKLENSLISKMRELKKKEQIASLQEQIARLEAAEKRRQMAAAAKAAAVAAAPVPAMELPASDSSPEPQSTAPEQRKRDEGRIRGRKEEPDSLPHAAAPAARRRVSPGPSRVPAARLSANERRNKSVELETRTPVEPPVSLDQPWEKPAPTGDLREFLSQQRAKKRGLLGEGEEAASRRLTQRTVGRFRR